jgi:CheY-like chemotaxis protein
VTALEAQGDVPHTIRSDIEIIRRNVELEAKLIDDLLDVTRISKGKIDLRQEVVDVHACLLSALEICKSEMEEKSLKLSIDLKATQHHVMADPTRLRQVFWNLLKNAGKFTPPEGRIRLQTANEEDRLSIKIADTGIGIDLEMIPKIFDLFEQGEQSKIRRFGGLGLGLSIAKALVDLHHGTLKAFSKGRGKGATFVINLATVVPVGQPPATALQAPAKFQETSFKILLVDDHPDTLRIMARLLQKWGYRVTTADCVAKALEQAASDNFDLLVSDLGLPDGSGLDIIRELKGRYGLRGIALSGYGTDDDLRESRLAGFEEHLIKPVSVDVLRTSVARVIAAPA